MWSGECRQFLFFSGLAVTEITRVEKFTYIILSHLMKYNENAFDYMLDTFISLFYH